MRIQDHRSGFQSFSQQSSAKERREAFKRSHRPGDIVRARFIAWEHHNGEEGLAWVDINGHALLAPLTGDYQPGFRFALLVQAIEPDILLEPVPVSSEDEADGERPRGRLHITI